MSSGKSLSIWYSGLYDTPRSAEQQRHSMHNTPPEEPNADPGQNNSVTEWIRNAARGDLESEANLFRRYMEPLARRAAGKLSTGEKIVVDGEDLVGEVFMGFLQTLDKGGWKQLQNRQDLWTILLTIMDRRITDMRRKKNAEKRGSGREQGESGIAGPGEAMDQRPMQSLPDREPTAQETAILQEEVRAFLQRLPDDTFRSIAKELLAGYSQAEMQQRLQLSHSTIERKVGIIRILFQQSLSTDS